MDNAYNSGLFGFIVSSNFTSSNCEFDGMIENWGGYYIGVFA